MDGTPIATLPPSVRSSSRRGLSQLLAAIAWGGVLAPLLGRAEAVAKKGKGKKKVGVPPMDPAPGPDVPPMDPPPEPGTPPMDPPGGQRHRPGRRWAEIG